MLSQNSFFQNYITEKENITAFVEFLKPPITLIVVGAGNDVMPRVDMPTVLGWDITVVDGRPNYVKPERFISSCQVLLSNP